MGLLVFPRQDDPNSVFSAIRSGSGIVTPTAAQTHSGLTIHTAGPVPTDFPAVGTATDAGDDSPSGTSVRHILEYVFIAIAITMIVFAVIRRLSHLKSRGQPVSVSSFFVLGAGQPMASGRTYTQSQNRIPVANPLYPQPSAYTRDRHRDRRTQAGDIDAQGRRIDSGEVDHDGELDDKDVLPAYDHFGSPPKYRDFGGAQRLGVPDNQTTTATAAAASNGSSEVVPNRTGVPPSYEGRTATTNVSSGAEAQPASAASTQPLTADSSPPASQPSNATTNA